MSLITPNHSGVIAEKNRVARSASPFSGLQVGFVCLGPEGQVEHATATACALFGATDPVDLRSRWNAVHEALTPALRARDEVASIVDVSVDVDGQSRCLRCEAHALNGTTRGGHVLLVQSSERATALEGALHLASRHQTLAALHATTVHDFRGSLNAIMLHMELLARTVGPGAPRAGDAEVSQRCIRAVRQELDRLAASVGRVLDESCPDQTSAAPFRLSSVVESVLSLVRAKAERQHVTMRVDASDATIEVMGPASEVRQAVLNLVNNALEAMPLGGELSLDLTTDGAVAVLTVSDTGRGLSEDLRHRIWDLYFSTKSQGLGIGLHVVKTVAHAHGGTVTLDQADSGARFTLRLPLAG